MISIILRTLRDRKISILMYVLFAVLLLWLYVSMFPSLAQQSDEFSKLFESYPEGFVKAFNIDTVSFSVIENFLAIEYYSLMWPILVMFMLVSLAGNGLAGEIERRTMEILLSRPLSRLKIFFARYLSGVLLLAVFTLVTSYGVIPLAKLHQVAYQLPNYWSVSVISFLFGMAVFSMAMLFSAMVSERSKAYMITGGILVVMYALNLVATFKESLGWLKYFSFFSYYSYHDAIVENILSGRNILVFAAVIVVCTALGAVIFKKRDIAVS